MQKKIYKSSNDKVLSGVCGGIGEYFEVDSVIVRLIWVLATLVYGIGFVLYIIAAFIIPEQSSGINFEKHPSNHRYGKNDESGKRMMGIILIGLGLFFIARRYVYWLDFETMLALGFIGFGIYLFSKKDRGKEDEE